MKKNYILILGVMILFITQSLRLNAQVTLVFEDFEDNTLTFTTNPGPLFHDNNTDFFTIVPLNGPSTGHGTINNIQGSNFFGANDIDDGNSRPSTQIIEWNGLDISTSASITMSGFFAEGDRLGGENWDADTSFRVEYQVDGGSFNTLFAIEAAEPAGDTTNNAPFVDIDFNGTGNDDGGAEITDTLTQYTRMASVSGSVLNVRIVFEVFNAGDEDMAIDNFMITGDNTLSTNDITDENFNVKVYPNPAKDEFVISSPNTIIEKIELYNMLGSLVLTTNKTTVDISKLSSGSYFARIISDKGSIPKRIIKN